MKALIDKKLLKSLKPTEKAFEVYDIKTKGLVLRVQPTGRMTYYYQYTLPGGKRGNKRARVKLGVAARFEGERGITPIQARDAACAAYGKLAGGVDPSEQRRQDKQRRRALTLREFLDGPYGEWVKEHRKTGHEKIVRIKGSFAELLDRPLSEITAWDLEQWRTARMKQKARKPGTLNRDLAYLKAALSKAVEWRMIQEHPLCTVKLLREDRKPRERYLTDEEEQRLMAALQAREERFFSKRDAVIEWCRQEGIHPPADLRAAGFFDYLRPLVIVSLDTGMRFGEVVTLEWTDVDLSRNRIALRGTLTKSSQSRTIPLTERAAGVLLAWQRQTGGVGLVFESPRGGRLQSIRDAWGRILADAQIRDLHFHDLRHSYASRLVAAGVDLYVVKELLGHSTISVTERYSHVAESMKAAAVARLDARPSNVIPMVKAR